MAPQHFSYYVTGREFENLALHCDALISSGLPNNAADALADPNWKAAMDREFKSLEENVVWELFKPPSGQGIISGKRQFAHKLDDEGNVVKYKARFVTRGFTQTPGIGFHDTYSPTAKLSVYTQNCPGTWGEAGYAFQSDGHKDSIPERTNSRRELHGAAKRYQKGKQMVCKLKRSLHGLKQSGRNWFECLSSHLFELNFSERFNIGERGPLTWFLGISFKWGDGSLTMKHQGM